MKMIIAAAALAVMLAGPASAEPGPIGQWLMATPVTLWDRGMDAAKNAARKAANSAARDGYMGKKTKYPLTTVTYDWANNEINITVASIFSDEGPWTHDRCNALRRTFLRRLAEGGTTEDDGSDDFDALLKNWLRSAIGRWFSHNGYRSTGRDQKLTEKLARIMFVEAGLHGLLGGITCRGRILDVDVASKPYTRRKASEPPARGR